MKVFVLILSLLLVTFQYRIWWGSSTVFSVLALQEQIADQKAINEQLSQRNKQLQAEVMDLKHGIAVIEARAREQLGMIQQGEVFYQIVKTPQPKRHLALSD